MEFMWGLVASVVESIYPRSMPKFKSPLSPFGLPCNNKMVLCTLILWNSVKWKYYYFNFSLPNFSNWSISKTKELNHVLRMDGTCDCFKWYIWIFYFYFLFWVRTEHKSLRYSIMNCKYPVCMHACHVYIVLLFISGEDLGWLGPLMIKQAMKRLWSLW